MRRAAVRFEAVNDPVRDVVVVGAGPAGLAAAGRAAECGARVLLLDDNPRPGGQIWRADVSDSPYPLMLPWSFRITERHVEVWNQARVVSSPAPNRLIVELAADTHEVRFSRLILATGARELFLPFPGWTLPGVCGAGGLQALVKSGLSIYDRRVVVAGSGPLLLAVAGYLRKHGAKVVLVAEQAPLSKLLRFGAANPGKLGEALGLRASLMFTPYQTGCWPVSAEGEGRLERVRLNSGKVVACDYLACGFGLLPNTELAELLGCRIDNGRVVVDEQQKTSVDGVFAAGEATGVGGLELSIAEGEIAGFIAGQDLQKAQAKFPMRARHLRFADSLAAAFPLRAELKGLPDSRTIVCRCEDVAFAEFDACSGWREAKLYTRCGMGPCQGRVCGPALEFLRGWKQESIRPPVFPARIESLATPKESS